MLSCPRFDLFLDADDVPVAAAPANVFDGFAVDLSEVAILERGLSRHVAFEMLESGALSQCRSQGTIQAACQVGPARGKVVVNVFCCSSTVQSKARAKLALRKNPFVAMGATVSKIFVFSHKRRIPGKSRGQDRHETPVQKP